MKTLPSLLFCLASTIALAQSDIEPGNKNINSTILNTGQFEWEWFQDARGGFGAPLGKELVKIQRSNQWIVFVKHRVSTKLDVDETDSLVLDAKTMAPIYKSYKGFEVSYFIQYGTVMKGSRTIFETKKKESLSEPFDGKYFDIESLPLLISCLPLSLGYQAAIPIVSYTSDFKPAYYRFRIAEVGEMDVVSDRSGLQSAWKVKVVEKKRGHEYLFYISKQTRRILRIDFEVPSALLNYTFFDKETDVNPIKTPFDEAETMAMITKGTSGINGQAYFKGYGKKMGGLRDSKKQYAEKGSIVLLIPNTPYFKEWVEFNLKLSKLSGPVYTIDWNGMFGKKENPEDDRTTFGSFYQLPPEVSKCMLVTTIADDKGNFSFQNLRPGEYLVFVGFTADKYSHTTKEYIGQSTTVYGDGSVNSYPLWDIKDWTTPGNVKLHKFITIKKEGEIVNAIFKD